MQLIRKQDAWSPFREFEELSDRVNRLFGLSRWEGNREQQSLTLSDWTPKCDITETDKGYQILAELPNVKKDDVHVNIENGILTLRGERKEEKETKDAKVHRREVAYGSFVRSFTLPADADGENVDATFKDGVLTVSVSKSEKHTAKGKRIEVR